MIIPSCIMAAVGCKSIYCKLVASVVLSFTGPTDLFTIAAIESGFSQSAESATGAYGMFQIMPITEQHMNQLKLLPNQLDRKMLVDNIIIAGFYWTWLESVQPPGSPVEARLAAYNWGPQYAYQTWEKSTGLSVGTKPFLGQLPEETRNYIKKYNKLTKQCSASQEK